MIAIKPYFIRAFFDWIVDNGWTPHLLVDAAQPGVNVPRNYVVEEKIVLNITPKAVRNLEIANDVISFSARFGGEPHNIYVPIGAVRAIYAQENGQGLTFPPETEPETPANQPAEPAEEKGKRPSLRVVKDEDAASD